MEISQSLWFISHYIIIGAQLWEVLWYEYDIKKVFYATVPPL